MARPYQKDREDLIIRMYEEGKSIKQIADEIGAGKNSINRLLNRVGICRDKNRHKFSPETEKQIALEYQKGISSTKLAEQYNCSDSTILQVIARNHLLPRNRGGYVTEISSEIKDRMLELWNSGNLKGEILQEFDFPNKQRRFKEIMIEMGISVEEIKARKVEGEKHHLWNGGRYINKQGYVVLNIRSNDPYIEMCKDKKKGRILEHRYIMAKHLGRLLEVYESVHHIDGNKENNDISNLQLRVGFHGSGQSCKCRNCGSTDIEFIPLD